MSGEWQDGDMAVIPFSAGEQRGMWLGGVWHVTGGRARSANYSAARRLVVIDPEDREQIERLSKAMHESDHIAPWHDLHHETRSQIEDAMQAALREFANPTPPKPDEPQNDGAVVEDAEGHRWIRTSPIVSSHLNDWVRSASSKHSGSDRRHWDGIAAVRVLSEGVQP